MWLLTLFLLAGLQSGQETIEVRIQEGQGLLASKQFEAALKLFDNLKQQIPDDSRPYFFSGLALAGANRTGEAVAEMKRAIDLDPEQMEYHLMHAELLTRGSQNARALEALQPFASPGSLESLDSGELWLLADLYYRLQKYDEALSVLERHSQVVDPDIRLHYRLAELYLKSARYDLAMDSFQKVADGSAEKGPAYYGIGLALHLQNRNEESKEALVKALQFDPANPDYICELATVLLALEEPGQAIEYLDRLADRADRYPRVHHLYAQSYRRMGDLERAREHMNRFRETRASRDQLQMQQDQLQVLLGRGRDQLARNQVEEALGSFMKATEIDPSNWVAHSQLARIYISSGLLHHAYRHLARMEEIEPEAFEVQYLLGSYWYEKGDLVKALDYARQARAIRAGNADARNLLGNVYYSMGRTREAIEEYEAALKLAPDRPDIRLNYESATRRP